MDLILLTGIATALLIILITLYLYSKYGNKVEGSVGGTQQGRAHAERAAPRRAHIARNQGNRLRNAGARAAGSAAVDDDEAGEEGAPHSAVPIDEKMGAKKRAKLEAKAEKKAQREFELQAREEKKKKEALLDEERKKQEQKEQEEEKKRELAEELEREKKKREEYEEYLKMKEAFSVEEEGYEEGDEDEKENLLREFVQHIKDNKVVILEELAAHFKLKTQACIDRITELQNSGTLTGVIDDRGKFIYISEDELQAIAKFIKQRGRIAISELAESSNNLINLNPVSS